TVRLDRVPPGMAAERIPGRSPGRAHHSDCSDRSEQFDILGSVSLERFIEDAGLFYERLGLSRTAGRVMGWLRTAESGDADAPQLAEALAVAKSSMSVALRQLEQAGLVERFRVRGERKSTRLNSSHVKISYAVFCLKKRTSLTKNINTTLTSRPLY